MNRIIFYLTVAGLSLWGLQCSQSEQPFSVTNSSTGNLNITAHLDSAATGSKPAVGVVTISAPGMDTITQKMDIRKDTISACIPHVPMERGRTIEIMVLDSAKKMIAFGCRQFDFVRDSTCGTFDMIDSTGKRIAKGVFGNDTDLVKRASADSILTRDFPTTNKSFDSNLVISLCKDSAFIHKQVKRCIGILEPGKTPQHPDSLKKPPVDSLKKPPFDSLKKPPFDSLKKPPFDSLKKPPFDSLKKPPFDSLKKPPVDSLKKPPVDSLKKPPVDSLKKPPVDSLKKPPVDSLKKPPVDSLKKPPVDSLKKPPVDSLVKLPISSPVRIPLDSLILPDSVMELQHNKTKWNAGF